MPDSQHSLRKIGARRAIAVTEKRVVVAAVAGFPEVTGSKRVVTIAAAPKRGTLAPGPSSWPARSHPLPAGLFYAFLSGRTEVHPT